MKHDLLALSKTCFATKCVLQISLFFCIEWCPFAAAAKKLRIVAWNFKTIFLLFIPKKELASQAKLIGIGPSTLRLHLSSIKTESWMWLSTWQAFLLRIMRQKLILKVLTKAKKHLLRLRPFLLTSIDIWALGLSLEISAKNKCLRVSRLPSWYWQLLKTIKNF